MQGEKYIDTLKTKVDTVNGAVNGAVKTVYDFIVQNQGCRKSLIAEKTNIPIKTVEKHIAKLQEIYAIQNKIKTPTI